MTLSNVRVTSVKSKLASAFYAIDSPAYCLLDSSNQANLPTELPVKFSKVYRCEWL